MTLTYELARDVLRADGDQRWRGSRFGDPHDWPRAVVGVLSEPGPAALLFVIMWTVETSPWFRWVLAVVLAWGAASVLGQVLVLVRARRAVGRVGLGTPARYVLAQGFDPCLMLFPPDGEEAPWGTVELADSRGGVPLAGDLMLLGELDPADGRPRVGSVVVPMLPTGALWPTSRLRTLRVDEGQLLMKGLGYGDLLRPARRGAVRDGGALGDARRAAADVAMSSAGVAMPSLDAAMASAGVWSRAVAWFDDVFGVLDVEAVHAAAGRIGVALGLVVAASIAYLLIGPDPADAAVIPLVVGVFALRAVGQAASGASPGQQGRGLRVVAAGGGRASWPACVARSVVAAILILSIVGIPILLLPALRRDRRGLHDWLAGTRVIRGASMPDGRSGWERWS